MQKTIQEVVFEITVYKKDQDVSLGNAKPLIQKIIALIKESEFDVRMSNRQVMRDVNPDKEATDNIEGPDQNDDAIGVDSDDTDPLPENDPPPEGFNAASPGNAPTSIPSGNPGE